MRIGYLLYRLIHFYELLILVECILSWFAYASNGIVRDIYVALSRVTEPFVGIFRKLLPSAGAGGMRVDFSPMIAILVLDLLKRVVIRM